MENKKNKILTYEQAKAKGLWCEYYEDGSYKYKTKDGYLRLIAPDGEDILKGRRQRIKMKVGIV